MVAELAAVRVQAPHFGDSAYVWTNVIGVILAALAGGAWWGGRIAARQCTPDAGWLLVCAGILLGCAPFVAGPLGSWLLPAQLPLDAAMPAMVRGSFAATILLFGLPMVLLGALSPVLVAQRVALGVPIGPAAGGVAAAGTVGSLAGTFAATHWLVPTFGCRATLAIAGGCLLLAAVPFFSGRGRAVAACVWIACCPTALAHRGPLRDVLPGRELLAERESCYQYLQVVREPLAPTGSRTMLVINEGLDSYHSVAVEGSVFTAGAYYDWQAIAPLLLPPELRRAGCRVLSIGDAAGSLRSVYAAVHPGIVVDAVDLDPACMELGDVWFRSEKPAGDRFAIDGRAAVRLGDRRWQVVHVDAYAHQVYVPAHLASVEFFRLVFEHLEAGGVIACNVGALRADDPVLRAIGSTMGSVFGHSFALQVPASRNFVLVARRGTAPEFERLRTGLETTPPAGLSAEDARHWRGVVEIAADRLRWHDVSSGGVVLTDDRPVLDELLLEGYVAASRVSGLVPCAGTTEPAGAEIAAYAARHRGDWPAVIEAVAASREATCYLRELAGDARWSLRQLRDAAAEYGDAVSRAPDEATRQRLLGKAAQLAVDEEPEIVAGQVARRNLWIAAGSSLAALALLAWLGARRDA